MRTCRSLSRHALVFLALAAPSLAGGADAQVATLPAGTRLRAAVPSLEPGPVVGPLLSRAGDTLTIGHLGESARITLPPGTLAALHESGGRPRLMWGIGGAAIGGVAGGLVLGVTGYLADPEGWGDVLGTLGFIAGAALGAPIGAAVGALVAPEQWVPLYLPASDTAAARAIARVEVVPGTRLRVTPVDGERFRAPGFLRGDSLTVERDGSTRVYRLDRIRRVEVRGGRDRVRGAVLWGAVLGGVALVFGGFDYADDEIGAGELIGGVAGNALVGAALGALFPLSGWKPLPLPAPLSSDL